MRTCVRALDFLLYLNQWLAKGIGDGLKSPAHNTRRVPGRGTNSCTFYPECCPDALAELVRTRSRSALSISEGLSKETSAAPYPGSVAKHWLSVETTY